MENTLKSRGVSTQRPQQQALMLLSVLTCLCISLQVRARCAAAPRIFCTVPTMPKRPRYVPIADLRITALQAQNW